MTDKEFATFLKDALSPTERLWLQDETACGSSARRVIGRALSILAKLDVEEQEEILKRGRLSSGR